jgi:hypothetical protein
MAKFYCPDNPNHKEFNTSVYESHRWTVDEDGEFIDSSGVCEQYMGKVGDNIVNCNTCGVEAVGPGVLLSQTLLNNRLGKSTPYDVKYEEGDPSKMSLIPRAKDVTPKG